MDKIEDLIREVQGPKGLVEHPTVKDTLKGHKVVTGDKSEYEALVNKYLKTKHRPDGITPKEFAERFGVFYDEKLGQIQRPRGDKGQKRGWQMPTDKNVTGYTGRRKEAEKVPERLREKFPSDEEFEKFKRYVKKGVDQNIDLTKLSTQGAPDGIEFDHGHLAALGNQGSNDPADQRLENRASNRGTGKKRDPSKESLRRTGHATTWDEAADYWLAGRPANYFDLTPQDKQRIWQGEDPDVVIGARKEAIKQNPKAKPSPQRHKRLQKLGMSRNPTSELGFATAPSGQSIKGGVKAGVASVAMDAGVNYLMGMDPNQAVIEAAAGPIDESNIGMTPTMGAEMRTLEDGSQVGYDPKLNRLMGEGVEGQGLAYKDGKPVVVERGSVAGHKSMVDMALETGQQLAENAPGQMAKLVLPPAAINWAQSQPVIQKAKDSIVTLIGNISPF